MNKILVVDDEPDILEEIAETLTEEGYQVMCSEGVNDALEILRNNEDIHLVLTDLKMPGKSGVDLINQSLIEFERDIRYIVMSGHANLTETIGDLDIKRFKFLKKPLDIEQLIETVKNKFDLLANEGLSGREIDE